MSLYLHNTLSGKKELFSPIKKGAVSLYSCGPTVYNFAHIGNLRSYVFADTLRRVLEYNGNKVKHVMNITDVGHLTGDGDDGDDKMVKALKREGKPFTLVAMREIADFYAEAFKQDLTKLNIQIPKTLEFASDHIKEDIELVKKLEEKGFAYKTKDGIYFDTGKFPSYGKLGNINLEGQKAGARVAVNPEKKNPADFSLWKFGTHGIGTIPNNKNVLGWESPWGVGFPGWHIECSAMSSHYFGQPFDIHTGGIDHIPVHHNNEIAQSEAAYGVPLAHYWLHNAFLNVTSGPAVAKSSGEVKKMAKSGENFLTLKKMQDEHDISPLAYRFWLLTAHYRKGIEWSAEAVKASQVFYEKILNFYLSLQAIKKGKADADLQKKFETAINDDMNTAEAIALIPKLISSTSIAPEDKKATLEDFDRVLGLNLKNEMRKEVVLPSDVEKLKEERELARKNKDWKNADMLRGKIEALGFSVIDVEEGSIMKKKATSSKPKLIR
ncbi:MAG: cysteine--tRNA ligase [Candidatus Taylorbacteria bacterium]